MVRSVCKIAAKRLCNKALQLRKEHAGALLKTTRAVRSLDIQGRDDFGEGCHTASSEPYYYDCAYRPVERASPIAMDEHGKCVVANAIGSSENAGSKAKGNNSLHKKAMDLVQAMEAANKNVRNFQASTGRSLHAIHRLAKKIASTVVNGTTRRRIAGRGMLRMSQEGTLSQQFANQRRT